ncbi:hypothetical protein GCM10027343_06260 [Noviherbaspirillum agri]
MKPISQQAIARLAIASPEGVVHEFLVEEGTISIGRAPYNKLVIEDPAISGEHAAITFVQGEMILEDMDSTNGTQVNGQPVKKHFLQDGDLVALGRYTVRYVRLPLRDSTER